jgi:hypothetical protein
VVCGGKKRGGTGAPGAYFVTIVSYSHKNVNKNDHYL